MLRAQLELFFIALGFFTRLPVPGWVEFSPEKLGQAARFLPWIGWIVGLIGAGVYGLAVQVLPVDVAIVLAMAASIRARSLPTSMSCSKTSPMRTTQALHVASAKPST